MARVTSVASRMNCASWRCLPDGLSEAPRCLTLDRKASSAVTNYLSPQYQSIPRVIESEARVAKWWGVCPRAPIAPTELSNRAKCWRMFSC